MIRISEEARAHIRRLLATEGVPGGGIRITVPAAGDSPADRVGGTARNDALACELEVAEQPAPADAALEVDGVRLFLDTRAADALDDAELVVDADELALALPEGAGCGSG